MRSRQFEAMEAEKESLLSLSEQMKADREGAAAWLKENEGKEDLPLEDIIYAKVTISASPFGGSHCTEFIFVKCIMRNG